MTTIKSILDYLSEQGVDFSFQGNPERSIEGFSSIENYADGTVSWLKNQSCIPENTVTRKGLVFLPYDLEINFENKVITAQPRDAFFSVLNNFFSKSHPTSFIGNNNYISDHVMIEQDVYIGHNCVIDGDITVGEGTIIHSNVTIINEVLLGKRCVIDSGTVIGEDGFSYYESDSGDKTMISHHGRVIIGNDVFIGPNTVIDRGVIEDTVVSNGCKIDGQCFIAHNCNLSKNVTLIAGSKLYGSVNVGAGAYIASAIVRNHIKIGENARVGMGSVVTRDIPNGVTVLGNPAKIYPKERD